MHEGEFLYVCKYVCIYASILSNEAVYDLFALLFLRFHVNSTFEIWYVCIVAGVYISTVLFIYNFILVTYICVCMYVLITK